MVDPNPRISRAVVARVKEKHWYILNGGGEHGGDDEKRESTGDWLRSIHTMEEAEIIEEVMKEDFHQGN